MGSIDCLTTVGLAANFADALFVNDTNARPVTAKDPFGKIDLLFFRIHGR